MAGIKIKSFEQLDPIEENDGRLILNYDGKTGKSTKKLSELINSTNILVTARWNPADNEYIPDRTFTELLNSINRGIIPVLRLIKYNNKSYCNMTNNTDDSITFKAPIEYGAEDNTKIISPKFLFTNNDRIVDLTDIQSIIDVEIGPLIGD